MGHCCVQASKIFRLGKSRVTGVTLGSLFLWGHPPARNLLEVQQGGVGVTRCLGRETLDVSILLEALESPEVQGSPYSGAGDQDVPLVGNKQPGAVISRSYA